MQVWRACWRQLQQICWFFPTILPLKFVLWWTWFIVESKWGILYLNSYQNYLWRIQTLKSFLSFFCKTFFSLTGPYWCSKATDTISGQAWFASATCGGVLKRSSPLLTQTFPLLSLFFSLHCFAPVRGIPWSWLSVYHPRRNIFKKLAAKNCGDGSFPPSFLWPEFGWGLGCQKCFFCPYLACDLNT